MRVYTDGQLERYLNHIGFEPSNVSQLRELTRSAAHSEMTLTRLQRLHMARVPFETAALYYSTDPKISLDPQHLFQKIVIQGRGGIWFELNTFFAAVMLSLDYKLYSAGARLIALQPEAQAQTATYGSWFVPLPFPRSLCLVPIA